VAKGDRRAYPLFPKQCRGRRAQPALASIEAPRRQQLRGDGRAERYSPDRFPKLGCRPPPEDMQSDDVDVQVVLANARTAVALVSRR